MMKLLVGSLLFVSSLAYAGERHLGAKQPVLLSSEFPIN